jgi:hypothetical protein
MLARPFVALTCLAAASAAVGQQLPTTTSTSVTYSIFASDFGGNSNGVVEPGESVLVRIQFSFTNQNGSGTINPAGGGSPVPGIIRGFGLGALELDAIGQAAGSWDVNPAHGYGISPAWNLTGQPVPDPAGAGLDSVDFGQFIFSPAQVNAANPVIDVLTALWTPDSYDPRWLNFQLVPDPAANGQHSSVYFEVDPDHVVAASCPADFGSIGLQIIPAPGSAALACLLLPVAFRRRR